MSLFSQKHITTDTLYTEGHWARYTQGVADGIFPCTWLTFHICLIFLYFCRALSKLGRGSIIISLDIPVGR